MITKFIEASDGNAYGKFLLLRMDSEELNMMSALPGFEKQRLLTNGGRRKFNDHSTLVVDLQTGRAVALSLDPYSWTKVDENITLWVCPLFRPFVKWLCQQGLDAGKGDIRSLPAYIEVKEW